MRKLRGAGCLTVFLFIYSLGVCLSLVYFNLEYAREHGFVDWLLLGQVIPCLKSTIWPYYLVRGGTGETLSETSGPRGRLSPTVGDG